MNTNLITAKEDKTLQDAVLVMRNPQLPMSKFRSHMRIAGNCLYQLASESCKKPQYHIVVLRAGLGLYEGVNQKQRDGVEVGFIDIERDKEHQETMVRSYKCRPDLSGYSVLVFEVMVATGGTLSAAVSKLKDNSGATDITVVSLICSPMGVERMKNAHPDVTLYAAVLDPDLDKPDAVVLGCGDAGDHLFGPK